MAVRQAGVVSAHQGRPRIVDTLARLWWTPLLWVLAAGALGFTTTAVFSAWLHLPRDWFLVPYLMVAGTFLYTYARCSDLQLAERLHRHWTWGVIGAVVVGAFMVWSVLR